MLTRDNSNGREQIGNHAAPIMGVTICYRGCFTWNRTPTSMAHLLNPTVHRAQLFIADELYKLNAGTSKKYGVTVFQSLMVQVRENSKRTISQFGLMENPGAQGIFAWSMDEGRGCRIFLHHRVL